MMIDGLVIGKVTSAVYSPRLEKNIALAMVASEHAGLTTEFIVHTRDGDRIAIAVENTRSACENVSVRYRYLDRGCAY